jgi:hypothetical protein
MEEVVRFLGPVWEGKGRAKEEGVGKVVGSYE